MIDEVHLLSRKLADTLLPALEDGMYPFPDGTRDLPRIMLWMAATTDVGLLPEAFVDRFQLIQLRPLTENELVDIIQLQPFETSKRAARAIAMRSAGYPRDLKRVWSRARDAAVGRGSGVVDLQDALLAFELLGLDEHGLYPVERRILELLWTRPKFYAQRKDGTIPKRYAQSERTIRTIMGLDEQRYAQIESKLLRLNYLTVTSAGRELTEQSINTYFAEK
jgi:holliday junction DNA helicase RuvB